MASINLSQSIGDLKADLKDHNYSLNQLTPQRATDIKENENENENARSTDIKTQNENARATDIKENENENETRATDIKTRATGIKENENKNETRATGIQTGRKTG